MAELWPHALHCLWCTSYVAGVICSSSLCWEEGRHHRGGICWSVLTLWILSLEGDLASQWSVVMLSFGDSFFGGNVHNLHPIGMLTHPLYQQ